MKPIYIPKGAANEYCNLALNIYNGCSNGCKYCYARMITKKSIDQFSHVELRKGLILELNKQLQSGEYKGKEIFLSFMCDPFCDENESLQITDEVMRILFLADCKIQLLTKRPENLIKQTGLMQLIALYRASIQIGVTLTFANEKESRLWEPNCLNSVERLNLLKDLKHAGFKTWASFEPVVDINQSLQLIESGLNAIDFYKIGKLNHNKQLEDKIDYRSFYSQVNQIMDKNKKKYMFKRDLLKTVK